MNRVCRVLTINALFAVAFLASSLALADTGKSAGARAPASCDDILRSNPSSKSGAYSINPSGRNAISVYCDMVAKPRVGWTLLNRALAEYLGYDTLMTYYSAETPAGREYQSCSFIDVKSGTYYSVAEVDPTNWRGGWNAADNLRSRDPIPAPGGCADPRYHQNSLFCEGRKNSSNIRTTMNETEQYTSTPGDTVLRPDPMQGGKLVESKIPVNYHEWYSCGVPAARHMTCWDGGECSHCGGGIERDATNPHTFRAMRVYIKVIPRNADPNGSLAVQRPLCESSHAASLAGLWHGSGVDRAGTRWQWTLDLKHDKSILNGIFEWKGSNGHRGKERVSGSFNSADSGFHLNGYSLENVVGLIITGEYEGTVSADRSTLKGAWSNGIPGEFSGTRQLACIAPRSSFSIINTNAYPVTDPNPLAEPFYYPIPIPKPTYVKYRINIEVTVEKRDADRVARLLPRFSVHPIDKSQTLIEPMTIPLGESPLLRQGKTNVFSRQYWFWSVLGALGVGTQAAKADVADLVLSDDVTVRVDEILWETTDGEKGAKRVDLNVPKVPIPGTFEMKRSQPGAQKGATHLGEVDGRAM